jgi:restriction endonuclease S subunit
MEARLVPISEIRKRGVWHFQPYSQAVQQLEADLTQSQFPVVKLQDFVENAKRGFIQKSTGEADGVLLIRPRNLTPSGIDLAEVTYINRADHDKLPQTQLQSGDVIVSLVATSRYAIAAVYRDNRPANITNNLVRLRLNSTIDPVYLAYYLNSDLGQKLIESRMTGAVMRMINLSSLLELPVVYPSLDKQHQIIFYIQNLQQKAIQLSQQGVNLQAEARQMFDRVLKEEAA